MQNYKKIRFLSIVHVRQITITMNVEQKTIIIKD